MPIYGNMLLSRDANGSFETANQVRLGFSDGRNETWLRDLLAGHSDLLSIKDVGR